MSEVITPRGIRTKAVPKDGAAFSITELQDIVDGYIDLMDVQDGVMVFDADGREKQKLFNPEATAIVKEYNPEWTQYIAGTALMCPRQMIRID